MTEIRCDFCQALLGEVDDYEDIGTLDGVALIGENYGAGIAGVSIICKGCVHNTARKYPNHKVVRMLMDIENELDTFVTDGPTGSFREITSKADDLMGESAGKLKEVRALLGDEH